MMTSDFLTLGLAWLAGAALGAIFFGGLWWTVHKGLSSTQPGLWFFAGLLLRMGTAMAGFHFVAAGQWQRLLACLLGFVMARLCVTWLTRVRQAGPVREASHAP